MICAHLIAPECNDELDNNDFHDGCLAGKVGCYSKHQAEHYRSQPVRIKLSHEQRLFCVWLEISSDYNFHFFSRQEDVRKTNLTLFFDFI